LEDEVLERAWKSEDDFEDERDVMGEDLNAEVTPDAIDSEIETEEAESDDSSVNPDVDANTIVVDDAIEMKGDVS
jgi:hypothetical protein